MQQDQTKKTTICFHKIPSTLAWNPTGAAVRQEISPVALEPMAAKHQEFQIAASRWVWLELSFLNGVVLISKANQLVPDFVPCAGKCKKACPAPVSFGWVGEPSYWKEKA